MHRDRQAGVVAIVSVRAVATVVRLDGDHGAHCGGHGDTVRHADRGIPDHVGTVVARVGAHGREVAGSEPLL